MSELGCEQLTRPMPAGVACSASNPSAIWPVTASAVPAASPADGALTVVAVPGSEGNRRGRRGLVAGAVFVADGVSVADGVFVGVFLAGLAAAGEATAAGTALSTAEPVETRAGPGRRRLDGTAIIEDASSPRPAPPGGQDLVTDVTAAPVGPRPPAGWTLPSWSRGNAATMASGEDHGLAE